MKNKLFLLNLLLAAMIIFSLSAKAQNINNQDDKKTADAERTDADTRTKPPEIIDFSGEGTDEIFPNNTGWQFFGPTRSITLDGSRKIIGSGSAVFGTTSGTTQIAVSICYLKTGGNITSFAGGNHLIADADSLRRTFAVSVSGTPAAGTYSVGYCVVNQGKQTLGNNDYVNGWIMVVN